MVETLKNINLIKKMPSRRNKHFHWAYFNATKDKKRVKLRFSSACLGGKDCPRNIVKRKKEKGK